MEDEKSFTYSNLRGRKEEPIWGRRRLTESKKVNEDVAARLSGLVTKHGYGDTTAPR